MSIDDLKKECKYCCREIDNSGFEGFRCTNKTVIKTTDSSWCHPKNADEPCSICEYCEPKEEIEMTIDKTIDFFNGLECHTPQAKDARDVAIETMRKYQMIEEIYKNWCYPTYFNATDAMNKLGEVLKDGKID